MPASRRSSGQSDSALRTDKGAITPALPRRNSPPSAIVGNNRPPRCELGVIGLNAELFSVISSAIRPTRQPHFTRGRYAADPPYVSRSPASRRRDV